MARCERQRSAPRQETKLSPHQEAHRVGLHREGRHTTSELAELFNIARSTVYRAIRRAESAQRPSIGP